MKIMVVKAANSLFPYGDEAVKDFAKMKLGEPYMVQITMPRNIQFHRKYFALVNTLFDMQENYDDPTVFRKLLTIGAGHFDNVTLPNGKMVLMPKSIAFEKMPEDEFQAFFSKTIDVAINKFGINREAVDKILRFI